MDTKEQERVAERAHMLATTAKVRLVKKGSGYTGNGFQNAKAGGFPPTSFVIVDNQDNSVSVYGEYVNGVPVNIAALANLTVKICPVKEGTIFRDFNGREHYIPQSNYVPIVKPVIGSLVGMRFELKSLGSSAARVVLSLNWHDKAFKHTSFALSIVDINKSNRRPPIFTTGTPIVLTDAQYNAYMKEPEKKAVETKKVIDKRSA